MTEAEVRTSASKLFAKHGLDDKGWTLEFDYAKRRNGQCRYSTKTISISRHYIKLNDFKMINDTLLHEIAHALTPQDAGHGRLWKSKCVEIGARPQATKRGIKAVEGKWKAPCHNCFEVFSRHRKPYEGHRHSCPNCSGGWFNSEFELIFFKEEN